MQEGWWINYSNGKMFEVREHEQFLRLGGNAKKMGVPPKVIAAFDKFKPVDDRDKFLTFVLQNAPLMRVRGHGSYVTFEFADSSPQKAMDAILKWGDDNAGDYTTMLIVNMATKRQIEALWKDYRDDMDSLGWYKVAKTGSVFKMKVAIVRELLRVARELGLK